jgi:spermidine/putrescine transport system ATP-binding protein
VAIARAIVNRPQVLLLDEPLAALDLKMRKDMQMVLKEMHRSLGITFIYVTHDQEEALTLSDTIVVMNEGVIQQIGSPTDIYNEPCNAFVADFIGESNILNATMVRDRLVSFMGKEFECIDEGFGENTPVDVVVRPEDVYIIRNAEAAMFHGTVRSCIFKGVHYEMFVDTPDGYEIMIQDYNSFDVGSEVGMMIKPADIHVMRKERTENHVQGTIIDSTHVEILGESFECEPLEGFAQGEEVDVAFDFDAVELTDDADDGISWGTIRFILYKGDRYHLTVRTDDGENVYVDTHDVWEDLDEVGITIAPQALRISKRN